MNKLFEKYNSIAQNVPGKKESMRNKEMFRKMVLGQEHITSLKPVIDDLERPRKLRTKTLVTFEYNPKTKERLPYWDKYPLVLLTEINALGWEGYNLHYMHPLERARILYEYQKNSRGLDAGKMFNEFKNHRYSEFCYKKYIANNVTVPPREIPVAYWELAIQLPYEAFQKASKEHVWNENKKARKKR